MASSLLSTLRVVNQDRERLANILKEKGINVASLGLSSLVDSVNSLQKQQYKTESLWDGIDEKYLEEPTDYFKPDLDMDAIYEADTTKEDYTNVMLVLLNADLNDQNIVASALTGFTHFKFSDDVENVYESTAHTWDAELDVIGTEGTHYRWILCYNNTSSVDITWVKTSITPYAFVAYKGTFGAFNFRYEDIAPYYVETKSGTYFTSYTNNANTLNTTVNTTLRTFLGNATRVSSLTYAVFANCINLRFLKVNSTISSSARGDHMFYGLRNCYIYFKQFKYSLDTGVNDNRVGAFNFMHNCTVIIDTLNTLYGTHENRAFSYQSWSFPVIEFNNTHYCRFKIGTISGTVSERVVDINVDCKHCQWEINKIQGNVGARAFAQGITDAYVKLHQLGGSIGDNAFNGTHTYGNIEFYKYNSTATIGASAFNGANILSVDFTNAGITSIGDYAFANCKYLNSMIMNENLLTLGSYVFQDSESLETLILGSKVNSITSTTFRYCGIKHLICSDLLNTIPESAFYDGQFESIVLGENTSSIGLTAFKNTRSLKSVYIPKTVTIIPANCFNGSAVEVVSGCQGVTTVNEQAFYNCLYLREISLPSLMTIAANVFYNCRSLETLEIPKSLVTYVSTSFTRGPRILVEEGITLGTSINVAYGCLNKDNILEMLYRLPTLSTSISLTISPTINNTSTNSTNKFWGCIKNLYVLETENGLEWSDAETENAVLLSTYMSNKKYSMS